MTHIVSPSRFASKKAFKEAVALDPTKVFVDDPSMFSPCSGSVDHVLSTAGSFTVTNHPKRSWFAAVNKGKDGKPKVS
jgi:hypothetical protein